MARWETDVLVVGAGPAGSTAAREAAAAGVRVLLLERKRAPGQPVQCAEYVPLDTARYTSALKGGVVQRVKGIRTFVQLQETAYTKAPGYILERSVFDQKLVCKAEQQGAALLLGTALVEKSPEGAIVLSQGKKHTIAAKIIIGGDGPRSLTAGWINSSGQDLAAAAQYTLELSRELADVEVYLDQVYPGGYAWLFPKGRFCNLGVAVDRRLGVKVNPLTALNRFMEVIFRQGKLLNMKTVRKTGGFIPIGGPLPVTQQENVLLVGDAGGFTHPISGAGILSALITGQIAGRLAACAVGKNDLSLLRAYRERWEEVLGPSLDRGCARREYLTDQWLHLGQQDFQQLARRTWIAFPEYFARNKKREGGV